MASFPSLFFSMLRVAIHDPATVAVLFCQRFCLTPPRLLCPLAPMTASLLFSSASSPSSLISGAKMTPERRTAASALHGSNCIASTLQS